MTAEEPGADVQFAANRIFAPFFDTAPSFSLNLGKSDGIFAIGSCFAREVEAAFQRKNYKVLSYSAEIMRPDLFEGKKPGAAYEFLVRYNSPSMLIEVQRLLGEGTLSRSGHEEALFHVSDEIVTDYHFSPSVHPGNVEIARARRAATLEYGAGLKAARLILITLGVNEVWYEKSTGCPLNVSPNPAFLRNEKTPYELTFLSVDDNVQNLRALYQSIKAHNPTAHFVVTVSPVPLRVTFTREDIVVANMRAKSTLVVAARQFCEEAADAHYFQSYEILQYSDPHLCWRGDKRHVRREAVDYIVGVFEEALNGVTNNGK